jgi:hypothetical protein
VGALIRVVADGQAGDGRHTWFFLAMAARTLWLN